VSVAQRQAVACLLTFAALLSGAPAAAAAPEERWLVAISSSAGARGEPTLRWAGRDAERFRKVFVELGGLDPERAMLLNDPSASELRRRLEELGPRLRARLAERDVTLLLYFSGHADREALHLGLERFPLAALSELARATGARLRVLTVDACEAGGLTRKGATVVPAFTLSAASERVEGEVVLTSSTAHEASLESAELGGAVFTHHLLSGLRGAADDGDGAVSLAEAYGYAYRMTVAATRRSRTGPQHPSFSIDLQGMGELVLTRPGLAASGASLGSVRLPAGAGSLLVLTGPYGPAVAELSAERGRPRELSLSPGTYWVQLRQTTGHREGRLRLGAGDRVDVASLSLRPVPRGALVRKGSARGQAHRIWGSLAVGDSGLDAMSPQLGVALGWRLDLRSLGVELELGLSQGTDRGEAPELTHREGWAGLALLRGVDLPGGLTLLAGARARLLRQQQVFGSPPERDGASERERLATTWSAAGVLRAELALGQRLTAQVGLAVGGVRLALDGEGEVVRPRAEAGIGLGVGL